MKLKKYSEHQALSWNCVVDIIFYKDESDNLYRLQYVIPTDKGGLKEYSSWIYVTNVAGFAPEIIDGETIKESKNEIRIKDQEYIYVIQKNAEEFKFFDIRDINKQRSGVN